MKPQTGILLRMLGAMLELICVTYWVRGAGDSRLVMGIKLNSLLMLGVFLGLAMVIAGLTLVKKPKRSRKLADLELNLDREAP